ncbi:MAG: hypothetical protein GF421_04525 [Candidatus Aminicenantes bacterium]|nr:hypothetical protein [Candidatus Aminicenantes bacterium]
MTEQAVSPEKLYRQILDSLEKKADPERAQGGKRYFKPREEIHLLGVRTPEIRKMVKQSYSRVKSQWDHEQAVELCEQMLSSKYLEAKAFCLLFLEQFVRTLEKEHLSLIKKWIIRGDCSNWATIDTLCGSVLSPMIQDHPECIDEITSWADSENKWLRRASIVPFAKPARKGQYIEVVHETAKKLFADEDDLIQKATGWILRESGKSDMDRLEKFLREHGKKIPRTALRYAIERFPEKKRKEILQKTK